MQVVGSFLRVADILVEAVDGSIWYRQQLQPELALLRRESRLLLPQSYRLFETLAQQIDETLAGSLASAGRNGALLSLAIDRHHRSLGRFKYCCEQLVTKAHGIAAPPRTGTGLFHLPWHPSGRLLGFRSFLVGDEE